MKSDEFVRRMRAYRKFRYLNQPAAVSRSASRYLVLIPEAEYQRIILDQVKRFTAYGRAALRFGRSGDKKIIKSS